MQAITLTYKRPTDTRGSRILARCDAGRIVHYWDYSLGLEGNYLDAARALFAKLKWDDGRFDGFVLGWLPNDKGAVAVPVWDAPDVPHYPPSIHKI